MREHDLTVGADLFFTAAFARTALLLCTFLLVVGSTFGTLSAQGTDADRAARRHFEAGGSYYESGDYEDALREFQRAYDLSRRPQLFYNISLCHQNLGHMREAADFLSRYLAEVSEIENRVALERRLENLRERVASGSTEAIQEPTATTEPQQTSQPETTTTSGETTATQPEVQHPIDAPPPPTPDNTNWAAIVTFSISGAALITAGVFAGLAASENSTLSQGCGATSSCSSSETSGLRTMALVTDISFGAALGTAVLGTIFSFTAGGSESSQSARLRPVSGPGAFGMEVAGTF